MNSLFRSPQSRVCSRCGKALTEAAFEFGLAIVLLGHSYCNGCQRDLRRCCHGCRKSLRQFDFDTGRAVVLGSDLYCDGCLEPALKRPRPPSILPPSALQSLADRIGEDGGAAVIPPVAVPAPPPAPGADAPAGATGLECRRASVRFVPPLDCELAIRPTGIRGLLGGNLLRLWVDVSEGGLRAVVSGRYAEGDVVRGRFAHPALERGLDFRAEVRYSKPSEKFQGCTLIGVKFERPSTELISFIRDVLGRNVAMTSLKPSATTPPSARSA